MTKLIHLLLFAILCSCLSSLSSARADDDPKPGKAEASQIIAYVELHSLPTGLTKSSLLNDYVIALAHAHQFDEAYKILTSQPSAVEVYLEEMHSAFKLTEMAEQLKQLESKYTYYFEHNKKEIDRYREEAAVMQAIIDKDIPQATDLLMKTSHRDYYYFIKMTQAKLGKPATDELIKSILAKAPEAKRPDFEETLIRWAKPGTPRIDYWLQGLKNTEKNVQRLQELENASRKEWLEEMCIRSVPLEHQEVAINKFLKAFNEEKENLTQEEISEYQRAIAPRLIKHKRFDTLLDFLKSHHPVYGSSGFYEDILSAVVTETPDELTKFIDSTLDAIEESPYELSLIDLLSRHGFVDKAEKNIDLLDTIEGTNWQRVFARSRIDFYRALYKTKIDDVDQLKVTYSKIVEELAKSEDTKDFTAVDVFGDQHLAVVAKRFGPEVALQLARAIPLKVQTVYNMQTDNAFGVCVYSLLSANEVDLAIEAGNFSTATERQESRLAFVRVQEIRKRIKPATWNDLEKLLPNDPDVLRGAIPVAIDNQNEKRALDLARRLMLKHRSSSNGNLFAKAGTDWAEKVLAVAKEVQAAKADDYLYKEHQESMASAMMQHLKFKDAEEAIDFANKYIKSEKRRHLYLLELAQRWSRGW